MISAKAVVRTMTRGFSNGLGAESSEKEEDYQEMNDVFDMFLLFLKHQLTAKAGRHLRFAPQGRSQLGLPSGQQRGHGDGPRSPRGGCSSSYDGTSFSWATRV